jgi:hypothetical protein
MRIFGKILLVLNLLLTGGFVYFAVQDWSGRKAIDAVGLRHILLRDGLPIEDKGPNPFPASAAPGSDGYSDYTSTEIPFAVEGPGGVMTKTVSPALLEAYFKATGDTRTDSLGGMMPVASQMAEVKRVFEVLKKQDDAMKLNRFGNALLRLAETFEERNEYTEWFAKGQVPELAHAMDLQFYRVLPKLVDEGPLDATMWRDTYPQRMKGFTDQRDAAAKEAADAEAAGNAALAESKKAEADRLTNLITRRSKREPKDDADRRFRLATLLVHLDTDAAYQKRVAMIVGMKQYVKAVDGQAGKYLEITDRVDSATLADQERFVGQYTQLRAMAIQRTQLVLEMAEIRRQLEAQKQKDQDLVNRRSEQLKDVTALHDKLVEEVKQLLAKQTLTEQALFLLEREIGLKLEDIYRMEADLRRLENERYQKK